ncbi:hypothetical protein Ct9H90mP29_10990 [bacterium]|nr:MAG: hypothetical protein Ct9H90mP29_10990 [bacterium]
MVISWASIAKSWDGFRSINETELGKEYFDTAQEILNFDIKSIVFQGPEEKLKQTEYTQPAIYIVSVILGHLMMDKGIKPNALAGHSLGEYSALTIAGAFEFKTGLKLVSDRAKFMAKAGQIEKGTMAAIVGIDDEILNQYALIIQVKESLKHPILILLDR